MFGDVVSRDLVSTARSVIVAEMWSTRTTFVAVCWDWPTKAEEPPLVCYSPSFHFRRAECAASCSAIVKTLFSIVAGPQQVAC